MKKIFYWTLFLLLIASLTGLATAVLPYELIVPAPARNLVLPVPVTPAS